NKDTALDALVREELGIDRKDLGGSAWIAACSSFAFFTIGAIFPVGPFLFASGNLAIALSLLMSGLALMLVGAATALFTGRGAPFPALRQLLIGPAAAGITYVMGDIAGRILQ